MLAFELIFTVTPMHRWQSDLTEGDEVKISHAVTNFEVISSKTPATAHC